MITAPIPVDEEQRLEDLYSYNLLDSRPEADYDELTDLAGYVCGCPISIITLVDKDRQWFKSQKGLDNLQTSRKNSFCSHAILGNEIMTVDDAITDERFHENPLVTGEPNIRFYAGSPIVSAAGHNLGTICVIDHKPKTLTGKQQKALTQLSKQVSRLLELQKKNMLIRERALEIISIKNNAITAAMQHNWNENKLLAYNLHEGVAQEIAGCLMGLQSAANNQVNRQPLLDAVKLQLQESLSKIKEISYSITPLATDLLPVQVLIVEYIEQVAPTFPFEISFDNIGKKNINDAAKTALLIHITEAWLTRLFLKKEITQINITLNINEVFELTIEDDAAMRNLQELGDHVYASLIKEMAIAQDGLVDIFVSGSGKNSVRITIPFAETAA